MAETLLGKTLGGYKIQSLLGKGGMSSVYKARQVSMDRIVAIKLLPREFMHDDTFLARFQQETRTVAKLEHIHILPVYDVGEDQGVPFIVMRYLTGGTLADLLNDRLLRLPNIVYTLGQIAGALDYAHREGIIHRDIKPSNILLDDAGNAYLADFGIARIMMQGTNLTGSRIIGTPPYVAPEQVRKGETVTGKVDIYALGIITYEMLTGELPYIDEDPVAVLMAHVLEPVPSPRDLDPNLPIGIDRVVQRCLAKLPIERFHTASDYAHAFAEAARIPTSIPTETKRRRAQHPTPPSGSHKRRQAHPTPRPSETGRRRSKGGGMWFWVMAVIGLIAIGVSVAAYVLTDGQPEDLLALLTPVPTRSIAPTITLTPTPQDESPPVDQPASTADALLLPEPEGGDRLAFASNRDGDYEIYLIDIDGTNLRKLTDNIGNDFDPAWSPDGQQIVFAYNDPQDGDSEIMIMNADGSNIRKITDNAATDKGPDWSPDGERIAFTSDRDGDFEIYTMQIDGSDIQQITVNTLNDLTPRWSPDGKQIGYHARVGNNRGSSEIYIIDAAGGDPTRLTENDSRDEWMDWSPDSTFITFTSDLAFTGGRRGVVGIDLISNITVSFTTDPIHDDDPVWSWDGGRIAFDSNRDGERWFDLYILDIASSTLKQLTFAAADDVTPAWQPDTTP